MSKIARRQFMQLSAVAAAGLVAIPSRDADAQDMPKIEESDPVAQSLKYVHDASSVDPASRANPAAEQDCNNCALVQGADGDEWRPCQIFPGKLVNAKGWPARRTTTGWPRIRRSRGSSTVEYRDRRARQFR